MQMHPRRPAPRPGNDQAMSFEEFYRELFAQGPTRQPLGPCQGLEPPALPARFKRIRGGNPLVSYELLVGEDGRINAKHESVAGAETYFIYEYDEAGHLLRAWRGGKLAEEYAYDGRGARIAAWSEKQGEWKYAYDSRGRLTAAGPWKFAYAADGTLREAWTAEAAFMLWYNQEGGLSRISLPGHRILRCESMAPGLPVEKYVDARPVESFTWRSPLQMATYQDHQRGLKMQFHYAERGRLPQAVTVQGSQGQAVYLLGYDQVGSLKAVASQDPDGALRVVKVVDYDSFGNILADSNPGLFLPLAFAGGLRDRFTGLVRFGHRDYDPTVGRFTAQDPLGDTGGDHDPYDYCVDDPVGRVDPEGLFLFPLLAGLAGATGLAWGGLKTAQKGAEVAAETLGDDTLKAGLPAKVEAMDKATTDAMTKVTGINAGIGAAATAGAAAPTLARGATQAVKAAPEAVAAAAGKGAELADKAKELANNPLVQEKVMNAVEFGTGMLPTPPETRWQTLGAIAKGAFDEFEHRRTSPSKSEK